MPEPLVPTACYLELARYSWGKRCFCAARSPLQWRLQGAGERWTGSPRCPCKECLGNKLAVICGYESIIDVCHCKQILDSRNPSLSLERPGQNEVHKKKANTHFECKIIFLIWKKQLWELCGQIQFNFSQVSFYYNLSDVHLLSLEFGFGEGKIL